MIRPATGEAGAAYVSKTDMVAALIRELIITGEQMLICLSYEQRGGRPDRSRTAAEPAASFMTSAVIPLDGGPVIDRE